MQQRRKCGNPHPLPKQRKRRQPAPAPTREQRAPSAVAQPIDLIERARLTLHDADPITGNEDTLYTLFYEQYRGYTIYKLRGKFVCFYDVEEAKALIKRFRREGYTSSDSVERYLPEEEYVWLNWRKLQRKPTPSRPMQRVS